jgi:hypothetical protein
MTCTRFPVSASAAISRALPTMKGYRSALAVCISVLLLAVPPAPALAGQTPTGLDISVKIGPLATQLNITKPVAHSVRTPTGGSAVVFFSTLHLHVDDDTQTPPFNADVFATGNAADPDTLVGGFLPATIRVKQDLLAGMTFQQAAADAQAKTGVTVTFFEDAALVEYGLLVGLIAVVCITVISNSNVTPTLNGPACGIQSRLVAGLTATGFVIPPTVALCATTTGTQ